MKSPGFSLIGIATLALGIGGATAVFSLVNGIILKPLPYEDPDRLALIFEVVPAMRERYPLFPVAASHFEIWRDQSQSFVNLTAFRWARMALTGAGEPRMVGAARVSAGFLDTLGTAPRMGRDFTPADDQPGNDTVIIITDRLWRNRFGASPSAIGQKLRLDGRPFEIIGVLPPGFRFAQGGTSSSFGARTPEADVFKPVAFRSRPLNSQYNYNVIGRLGPGVSQQEAQAELNVIQSSIAKQIGEGVQLQAALRPMHETLVGDVRTGLYLALAAVGTVLLIACVNLANLLLVRGSVRRREMAIRTALGAGGRRLLRQAMVESLCLAVVGGGLGVAVAYRVVDLFVRYSPVSLPRLAGVGVDGNVLAFAA
ncbi:MAG: hypothetical protein GY953_18670, partial [bacterium]|nr:hypothetical protein [bacterium]